MAQTGTHNDVEHAWSKGVWDSRIGRELELLAKLLCPSQICLWEKISLPLA